MMAKYAIVWRKAELQRIKKAEDAACARSSLESTNSKAHFELLHLHDEYVETQKKRIFWVIKRA